MLVVAAGVVVGAGAVDPAAESGLVVEAVVVSPSAAAAAEGEESVAPSPNPTLSSAAQPAIRRVNTRRDLAGCMASDGAGTVVGAQTEGRREHRWRQTGGAGAEYSDVGVDLQRCQLILIPRVLNLVSSVPAQQRFRRDDPAGSPPSGQGRRDRTEQAPVLLREGWAAVLAVKDGELVAQHDDLKVLRGPESTAKRANDTSNRIGARNSAVVVDRPRWGLMLSPRVPNLVPIPDPRMERVTPGQRPRPNYGHPQEAHRSVRRIAAGDGGLPRVTPRRRPDRRRHPHDRLSAPACGSTITAAPATKNTLRKPALLGCPRSRTRLLVTRRSPRGITSGGCCGDGVGTLPDDRWHDDFLGVDMPEIQLTDHAIRRGTPSTSRGAGSQMLVR